MKKHPDREFEDVEKILKSLRLKKTPQDKLEGFTEEVLRRTSGRRPPKLGLGLLASGLILAAAFAALSGAALWKQIPQNSESPAAVLAETPEKELSIEESIRLIEEVDEEGFAFINDVLDDSGLLFLEMRELSALTASGR